MNRVYGEFLILWDSYLNQFSILFPYWVIGILLSAFLSSYGEGYIEKLTNYFGRRRFSVLYLLPACLLGVISPLCMYGTIPLIAALSRKGLPQNLLVSFMISSIVLNPTLFVMSLLLGIKIAMLRLLSAIICGFIAGIIVTVIWGHKPIFKLDTFLTDKKSTYKTKWRQFLYSLRRNFEVTSQYLLIGILLTVILGQYIPTDFFIMLLGKDSPFAILASASIGVPLYMCGGGTIPLIRSWLETGMSVGAAAAFMISGPATKLNNLSAVKMILGKTNFVYYIAYTMLFSIFTGYISDLIF